MIQDVAMWKDEVGTTGGLIFLATVSELSRKRRFSGKIRVDDALLNHLSSPMSKDFANNPSLAETLTSRWLGRYVISCPQAASAKDVPLQNELKTLVLQTSNGVCAVHLRGDHRLSLRAVKRFLGLRQAYLMPVLEMSKIGLTPGTVCPFLPPVWNMLQLLSSSILDLEFTTTNNGSLSGYFVFEPQLLLKAPQVKVGDFELTLLKGESSR